MTRLCDATHVIVSRWISSPSSNSITNVLLCPRLRSPSIGRLFPASIRMARPKRTLPRRSQILHRAISFGQILRRSSCSLRPKAAPIGWITYHPGAYFVPFCPSASVKSTPFVAGRTRTEVALGTAHKFQFCAHGKDKTSAQHNVTSQISSSQFIVTAVLKILQLNAVSNSRNLSGW